MRMTEEYDCCTPQVAAPNLDDIVGYDQWARKYAAEVAGAMVPAR